MTKATTANATFSALLAGQAVHGFIAGEVVDHSALRNGFVVFQLILGVTLMIHTLLQVRKAE
jgi:hypothetical protein